MTTSHGARAPGAAADALLGVLIFAAVAVGIYAGENPNGIEFRAPWPFASETFALIAGLVLAGGISAKRRGGGTAMLLAGALLSLAAIALLALVAFLLSFSQV